jgi:hypothetical protein
VNRNDVQPAAERAALQSDAQARGEEVFLGGRSTNRSDLVAVQLPGLALEPVGEMWAGDVGEWTADRPAARTGPRRRRQEAAAGGEGLVEALNVAFVCGGYGRVRFGLMPSSTASP